MAYLGNDLQVAYPTYKNIDDISGSFNSSTTSFPLRVNGVAPVPPPLNSQQCLISVGGVVQRPDDSGSEGFRLSGGNIIFASAPTTGADFFGVILAGADYINVGANFPSGTAAVPSITFDSDLDTGIFNAAANEIGFATGGVQRFHINSAGQLNNNLGTAGAPSYSFTGDLNTGIYSPGADQLAISTNGTGRLFINSNGNIGIGGAAAAGRNFALSQELTGSTTARAFTSIGNVRSDVTGIASYYATFGSTEAASFTLGSLRHYTAIQGVIGAGSTVTNQVGYLAESSLTGATNNYGFYSDIASGTGRWNFYANGTADSYFASNNFIFANGGSEKARFDSSGRLGIGTSDPASVGGQLSAVCNGNLGPVYLRNLATSGITADQLQVGVSQSTNLSNFHLIRCYSAVTTAPNVVHYVRGDGQGYFAGALGIGTTSPDHPLVVQKDSGATEIVINAQDGTSTANLRYRSAGATIAQVGASGSSLLFSTGITERARIDSSGRLLVGTSSARTNFNNSTVSAALQIEGTGGDASSASLVRNSNDANPSAIRLAKSRGTSNGSNTVVASGDVLGSIQFQGADGTEFVQAAVISAEVDGTPGANDMPGRLVFSTTADGASSPTERMRIQSDGKVLIGTTTAVDVTTGTADGFSSVGTVTDFSRNGNPAIRVRRRSSDGDTLQFYRDTTLVGSISVTTTATAYNTSSDYRLKENVAPVTDGITRLQQLKPSRFNFIADPAKTVDGFLAHEVQTIVPEAITGEKDAVDDEGNPQYQGIDQSKLVPLLTAALQEAVAKIESLEARLTAAGL